MIKTYYNHKINAKLILAENSIDIPILFQSENYLSFIWNTGKTAISITIDNKKEQLVPGQLLCFNYLQKVKIDNSYIYSFIMLQFNKEFYCIHTNDSEVSCNGILFFGSEYTPIISLSSIESKNLNTLIAKLKQEFNNKDSHQEEMLRLLLKEFIIRNTRIAKKQLYKNYNNQKNIDLIRKFNVLVEENFKTKKTVSEYAEMLNKSPKTITNVFHKHSHKTPLQVIHNRIIMEAKKLFLYTDKTAKEVGHELGFEDAPQFSKFFKKCTGKTISEFKLIQ
ncbi:helix-turn-helix domain-containing protein [Leptobacterium sp. I13]|uniref:AraC family transcriptional regulator n=1 Tax=Leptobacterium meishanense TaxID=3128904 RepID=UPI0030ECB128